VTVSNSYVFNNLKAKKNLCDARVPFLVAQPYTGSYSFKHMKTTVNLTRDKVDQNYNRLLVPNSYLLIFAMCFPL